MNRQPKKSIIQSSIQNIAPFLFLISFLFVLIPVDVLSFSRSLPPEKIFSKMLENLGKVKSGEDFMRLKIKAEIEDLFPETQRKPFSKFKTKVNKTLTIQLAKDSYLSYNFYDPKNPAIKLETKPNLVILPDNSKTNFSMDYLLIGDVIYLRLKDFNLENVDFLETLGLSFFLKSLRNQWIKLDPKEIESFFRIDENTGIIDQNLKEQLFELNQQEVQEALVPDEKKAKQFLSEIKKAFIAKNPFKFRQLPSEKINGVDTYRYRVIVDKNKLGELLFEIVKIWQSIENEQLSKEEINDLRKFLDELLSSTVIRKLEINIGKKDLLPYKVSLTLEFKNNPQFSQGTDAKFRLWLQFSMISKNYNKPIKIEVPKDPKSLEEVLKMLPKLEISQ
jgi:hypothetical protein